MSVARPPAQPRFEATSVRRPGRWNVATIVARPARSVRTARRPARRTAALAMQRALLERSLTRMRTRCPARTRLRLSETRVGNPDADVEAIAETLFTVWARTFLLADPPPA